MTVVIFGAIVNIAFFVQSLASSASLLSKGTVSLYVGNQYALYAALIFPFVYTLVVYAVTGLKRAFLPILIQVLTVAFATLIIIADTIQPSESSVIFQNFPFYIRELAILTGFSFLLLFMLGFVQAIGVRMILGLQMNEQPKQTTFLVDVGYDEILSILDNETLFSLRLVKKKTDLKDASAFLTRRTTGDEAFIVIGKKDQENSILSIASYYVKSQLEQTNSPRSKLLLDGLIKTLRGRIREDYPYVSFKEIPSEKDQFSVEAISYSTRRSQTSVSKLRSSFVKITGVPRYYLYAAAVLIFAMISFGLAYYYHALANFNSGNLADIEVILGVALLIDVGFAINDQIVRRKE